MKPYTSCFVEVAQAEAPEEEIPESMEETAGTPTGMPTAPTSVETTQPFNTPTTPTEPANEMPLEEPAVATPGFGFLLKKTAIGRGLLALRRNR